MAKGKQKMVYLDNDILEDLEREANMSQLINTLLREHFRKKHLALMTQEERIKHRKILELKLKFEKELKDLQDGN